MRNWNKLRERYLRDALPIRLGGIAANMARVKSFSESPDHQEAVADLLEESKYFIEWAVPSAALETQAELVELQIQLALWQHTLGKIYPDLQKRKALGERARDWSERVLNMAGTLESQTIKIRPAACSDANAIARVHVDSWRTTYRGVVPDEFLANLSYERREEMWKRALCNLDSRTFVLVAEDQFGAIVGFASGGPSQDDDPTYRGELYAIYILAPYQGRGLGRQLVRAVARRLKQDGYPNMLLWVLTDNASARAFYERLGGTTYRSKDINIGGTMLMEIAYVWDDLHKFE